MVFEFFFILSVAFVIYVYVGYPVCIFLIGKIRECRVFKNDITPPVTIVIAAYNEERVIGPTLENKLSLAYPRAKVQILVVSDGSTDKTEPIVAGYEAKGVRLIKQTPRGGKTSALNKAVLEAKGEIIVFSDANSMYEEGALRSLVRNFADPSVGYVTGKMIYTNPAGSTVGDGCTAYMKYENLLRKFETKVGSVVGVDGGIDAIRKSLYQPMNPDQLPDFVLPLKVVLQGYRVVYEPEAILKEPSLEEARDEYRMRVRVSLRALWGLWDMRDLLYFNHFRIFGWQLWSHKVLRYAAFLLLLTAYLTNLILWFQNDIYKWLFIIQNVGYAGALLYHPLRRTPLQKLSFLNYFFLLNLASGHAFIKFLLGQKQIVWTPRKG